MEKKIAQILSYLFHPLLIPSCIVVIFMFVPEGSYFEMPLRSSLLLLAFVFLSTFIFPVLLLLTLKNLKVISNFQMNTKRERVFPLVMMSIIFYAVFYLLKQGPFANVFNLFMLGSTLLLLLSLLINYVWKISLHMIAQGGLFGALLGMALRFGIEIQILLYFIIVLAGIIGFARLKLDSHKPAEVYGGFILGAGVMAALFLAV